MLDQENIVRAIKSSPSQFDKLDGDDSDVTLDLMIKVLLHLRT